MIFLESGMRKFRIDQDFLIEHWHMIYVMSVVFAEIYVWMKLKLNFRYKISINWLISINICYFKPLISGLKIAFSPFWSQLTYFSDWEWLTVLIPAKHHLHHVNCSATKFWSYYVKRFRRRCIYKIIHTQCSQCFLKPVNVLTMAKLLGLLTILDAKGLDEHDTTKTLETTY